MPNLSVASRMPVYGGKATISMSRKDAVCSRWAIKRMPSWIISVFQLGISFVAAGVGSDMGKGKERVSSVCCVLLPDRSMGGLRVGTAGK